MKRTKILCLAAALTLSIACFSGCGNKVVDSDVTTVTVWTTESHSKTAVERLVNEFNNNEGKAAGVAIEYKVIEGDSFAKSLELALQTGQGPDLMPSTLGVVTMVENGYAAALEDLPGGAEFAEKYKDELVNRVNTYKGKTYTVPTTATTRGLIYNKDMFKAAGIVDENGEPTPPETFDEMREYAKRLTNKSNNQFGMILPQKWTTWVASDMLTLLQSSVGHCGYNPVTDEYDYSGLAPIINTYKGIIEDGSMYPGAEGIDNDTARAYFSEGLIGMKIAYSFDVGVLNDQFPAKCDWGVAPLPVVDKNNCYKQVESLGSSFCINAASVETKGGDKLMTCMKWFASDEYVTEMYKGGFYIPIDWDIVKDVELTNAKKGWKEFAEMTKISHSQNQVPQRDTTGKLGIAERIKNEVLAGKISAEEMLKQHTKDSEEASQKYYAVNTEESREEYVDKTWNVKR